MEIAKLSVLKDLYPSVQYHASASYFQISLLFQTFAHLMYYFPLFYHFNHFLKMYFLPTNLLPLKMYFIIIFHIDQPDQSIPNALIRFYLFLIYLRLILNIYVSKIGLPF
jgi:hypothetical protein